MSAEEKLAKVVSTFLGVEDHGIFTAMLQLDYGGSNQGAGQYDLRTGPSAYRFVTGVCRACGAESWEQLPGKVVFALIEDGLVRGLRRLPFAGEPFEFRFDSIYDEATS